MTTEEQADHPRLEAILEENRQLRSLLEAAQASGRLTLWERDRDSGLARWGAPLFDLLGLPAQAGPPNIQGATELIDPADRERVRLQYEASLTHPGHYEARYRMRRADGRKVHVHAVWIVPGRGSQVQGMIFDDTALQLQAQQTEQVRQQLAMLSRMIGLFLWWRDYRSGRFLLDDQVWQPSGETGPDTGLSLDEFRQLVHPQDLGSEIQPLQAGSIGDEPVVAEIRFRRPGQPYRTMLTRRVLQRDEWGQPTGMLGVGVDVTDQVQARERHRQLLEHFDLLVETTGVGVWSWDLDEDRHEWNEAMRAIYGLGPSDPLPRVGDDDGVTNVVVPEDRQRVARVLGQVCQPGTTRAELRYRIVRPDGQQRILVGRALRMDGEHRMVCGIVLDVTESHRAEQALRDKEIAERADRAKTDFLSRVSHELRTPLNAVLGFSDMALQDQAEALGPAQRTRLEHVRQAGRHLLGLVDDLLDIGRQSALPANAVNDRCELAEVVAQVLAWQGPAAAQSGVKLEATGRAPPVIGGERHWRQILSNLVSNAIKFNRRGGRVLIALGEGGSPVWPELTVIDDGRGLSDDQQQHLFEPFNRLGAERDGIAGTGLGLSIVRQLVQALGGEVDVQSDPGRGTQVRVRAPGPAAHRFAPPPPALPEQLPLPSTDVDVVYVEDNPVNVLLVREILARRPQLRLQVAGTLAEALPLVRRVRPALLMVDMHLPDGHGIDLLQTLNTADQRPARHCVALSADVMPEEIARARAAGFDDYWAKPIDVAALLAKVDRLLQPVA